MLVYFVNHSTAPINLGGAERSLIKLVEDWYASDPEFEAVFITKAPRGKFIAAIEDRGWRYRAFRFRGWALPNPHPPVSEITYFAHDDYAATGEIIRMMEARRPDLVVTNTVVAPWGAFAAAVLGIPHAWFVREYGDLDHGLSFQAGRAGAFADIALLSQAVFTNSLALKSHIGQYLDEDLVTVAYPQLDIDAARRRAVEEPERPPFPAADPGLRITVVGRLSDSKGQWRAVEAIGKLASRGIAASLCLVGGQEDPDTDRRLMSRATALGIRDRISIVGERANPFPYVAAADVCITPSGIEAFGRSTLEYMAIGKPVIASAGGGSAELVLPGKTGYLFAPEDVSSLADLLETYARNPDLVRSQGFAAEDRARELMTGEFSSASVIERLKHTATMDPYRLPNIARYWFELPGYYFASAGRGPRITVAFIRTRLRGRVGAILRRGRRILRRTTA